MEMNWLAVIVAAITSLLLGFVWYHPKVFGTAWMQDAGMTEEKARQGNMGVTFGTTFVMGLIVAWGMTHYGFVVHQGHDGFDTFKHGVYHGGQLGLLFGATGVVVNALFEQRGWRYIFINAGYWVTLLSIMGGILSAWQ
jgi:Protein of unknown function (DUF1761)